jgi:hypothetical protein
MLLRRLQSFGSPAAKAGIDMDSKSSMKGKAQGFFSCDSIQRKSAAFRLRWRRIGFSHISVLIPIFIQIGCFDP